MNTKELISNCLPFLRKAIKREEESIIHDEKKILKAIESNREKIDQINWKENLEEFRSLMEVDHQLNEDYNEIRERREELYHANTLVLSFAYLNIEDQLSPKDKTKWEVAYHEKNLN